MPSYNDTFTRGDSGTLGANWTNATNGFSIVSNAAAPTGGGANNYSYWSADSFISDHYSQVTLTAGITGGVTCRTSGNPDVTGQSYLFLANTGSNGILYRVLNASYTALNSSLGTITIGDAIKITCVGSLITCWVNGSSVGSATDGSPLSGGSPGIWGDATFDRMINWSGGDLGGATAGGGLSLLGVGN